MIYFVQALTGGPIKIGFSDNVRRRMSELRSANGQHLVLLGVMDGGKSLEQHLHTKFKRLQGEWFDATPELFTFISLNCEEELRPPYGTELTKEELQELRGDDL